MKTYHGYYKNKILNHFFVVSNSWNFFLSGLTKYNVFLSINNIIDIITRTHLFNYLFPNIPSLIARWIFELFILCIIKNNSMCIFFLVRNVDMFLLYQLEQNYKPKK